MARRIARVALVALLMVGLVAMYSWGHRGHREDTGSEAGSASPATHHHAGMAHHGDPESVPDTDQHDDHSGGLLSLLIAMVLCGGMLLRSIAEFLRPLWSEFRTRMSAIAAALARPSIQHGLRPHPPRLTPTSLLLNRIAVLRI
jgi:hypothetical protein